MQNHYWLAQRLNDDHRKQMMNHASQQQQAQRLYAVGLMLSLRIMLARLRMMLSSNKVKSGKKQQLGSNILQPQS